MRGRGTDDRRLVLLYIFLATGCAVLGTVLVFATLFICRYFAIDITKNYWVLVIPIVLTLLLNILLVEVAQRFRR